MDIIQNPQVIEIFNNYPANMRHNLRFLRQLIVETALETEDINQLEETLKWGEPSYLTNGGSTIRIHWKKSNPDHYMMYFNCKTKLVDTFRELFRDEFLFEGNRAIIFIDGDEIPMNELKLCISLSLTYHSRKHLPMLGL